MSKNLNLFAILFTILLGTLILGGSIVAASLVFVQNFDFINTSNSGSDTTKNNQKIISVNGNGEVYSQPNMVTINLSVSRTGNTTNDAMQTTNTEISKITEILLKNNINKEDIQTTSINIYPEYDYSISSEKYLIGQKATQSLNFKIKKIDQDPNIIGKVFDEVTKINQIEVNGINFGIENKEQISEEARIKAYDNAKSKAENLAKKANLKILKTLSVSDTSTNITSPLNNYNISSNYGGSFSTNVESGQLLVSAQLTVTFEVE